MSETIHIPTFTGEIRAAGLSDYLARLQENLVRINVALANGHERISGEEHAGPAGDPLGKGLFNDLVALTDYARSLAHTAESLTATL